MPYQLMCGSAVTRGKGQGHAVALLQAIMRMIPAALQDFGETRLDKVVSIVVLVMVIVV